MDYVSLGNTDLKVSKLCLGTMTWGEQNTEQEAHEQLDFALDQGINFIDTAEMYPVPPMADTQGRTEAYIGSWLAKRSDPNPTKMESENLSEVIPLAQKTPIDGIKSSIYEVSSEEDFF